MIICYYVCAELFTYRRNTVKDANFSPGGTTLYIRNICLDSQQFFYMKLKLKTFTPPFKNATDRFKRIGVLLFFGVFISGIPAPF